MKPLLVIFNPRSIPEFYKAIEKINGISKLWIKYFPQDEAYNKAREFFLQSDYTHLMILPDDLIVTQADVDAIHELWHRNFLLSIATIQTVLS